MSLKGEEIWLEKLRNFVFNLPTLRQSISINLRKPWSEEMKIMMSEIVQFVHFLGGFPIKIGKC